MGREGTGRYAVKRQCGGYVTSLAGGDRKVEGDACSRNEMMGKNLWNYSCRQATWRFSVSFEIASSSEGLERYSFIRSGRIFTRVIQSLSLLLNLLDMDLLPSLPNVFDSSYRAVGGQMDLHFCSTSQASHDNERS